MENNPEKQFTGVPEKAQIMTNVSKKKVSKVPIILVVILNVIFVVFTIGSMGFLGIPLLIAAAVVNEKIGEAFAGYGLCEKNPLACLLVIPLELICSMLWLLYTSMRLDGGLHFQICFDGCSELGVKAILEWGLFILIFLVFANISTVYGCATESERRKRENKGC